MISSASMNDPSLCSSTCSKIRVRHQLEREVDVADLHAEQRLDQAVVDPRVDRAQRALAGAVEAVGADDVDVVLAEQPHRTWELGHVERQVGVGVQHQIARGRGETGLHRSAELAVAFVMDHTDVRVGGRQAIGDLPGPVGRLVVDHDQLVVADVTGLDQTLARAPPERRARARCSPLRSTSDRTPTASRRPPVARSPRRG